jgi:CMP-N-acetylneuraminic acid synthetase
MNEFAVILPLKENSQRIPNKNFKIFNGKPLFFWILDRLLSIPEITEIIIDTDNKAKVLGYKITETDRIKVKERSKDLIGDDVSMNKIINHNIQYCKSNFILMTHSTNPLLSSRYIKSLMKDFVVGEKNNEFDSIFTVNEIQSRLYDDLLKPINHNPSILSQTQDLQKVYEENSNLYLFTKESFKKSQSRIGLNPAIRVTPKLESIDIDFPEQWQIAEIIAENLKIEMEWLK